MNDQTRTNFTRFGGGRGEQDYGTPAKPAGSVDRLPGLAPCASLRNLRAVIGGAQPDFGAREVGVGFGMRASEIQTANEGWAGALVGALVDSSQGV